MPQYLIRKDNTFYFRQGVPAELRPILGRREIKKSLGRDYVKAVRACKLEAVRADNLLAEARFKLDSLPVAPYSPEGIRRTQLVPLTVLTSDLEQQFANLMRNSLLENDLDTRIAGLDRTAFDAYGQEIDASIEALKRQLAMGQVEPMLPSVQSMLLGKGYLPELSADDMRRLAYLATQAALEAYQGIAARHQGGVVKDDEAEALPCQYKVQNARSVNPAEASPVTWQALYEVWAKECVRPNKTQSAYLAAMKLFQQFCTKSPHLVTREEVLAYRDFLLQQGKHDPATVANKIGFVGTLVNSGRNHSVYARHLPHNPFQNIKIKQSKRGQANKKRLPFNDTELATIFTSPLYTQGDRPRGGAGEAAVWIPAIAYLTGMNLEEIALLHVRQFHQDASGHTYIHTEDGKNENRADRDVPLHPMLIDAGLLDYVKTCQGRLFPKVRSVDEAQSSSYSKWFGRYLDRLHITASAKVFHSFRHLFKDLCRDAGLDDSVIDQICGHEPGTVGGRYGKGRRIDVLAALLAKVKPPVALPKIFFPQGADSDGQ